MLRRRQLFKNVASQKIGVQGVTAADGTAFTSSVTVYVTGDAGTQGAGSVGAGACTHEGEGYHTYSPAQAETNYDLVAFTFKGTGMVPQTVQVYTSAVAPDVNVTQFAGSNITSASGIPEVKVASIAANAITATAINADAITAAKIADGAIDAATFAANAITAAKLDPDVTTELQSGLATAASLATAAAFIDTEVASILAAVDTEIAAIKAKTDSLTFTVANVLDANVQRINDVAITGDGSGTPFGV